MLSPIDALLAPRDWAAELDRRLAEQRQLGILDPPPTVPAEQRQRLIGRQLRHRLDDPLVRCEHCPDCDSLFIAALLKPRRPTVTKNRAQRCIACQETRRLAMKAAAARRRRAERPAPLIACQHCGSQFEATRRSARFCSDRCRVAAHRRKRLE